MTQELTCEQCGKDWTRAAVRGRKPKVCPACRGDIKAPQEPPPVDHEPVTPPAPKRRRKSKWDKTKSQQPAPALDTLPFTERASGWCTDYDPNPAAQHDKCDGDLVKYRCPCDCHDWS